MLLGTHSGPFHADDVLAAALIRTFLDADAKVVRSRDPEVLATADIVFDVGHVFDADSRRFDHHQREYEGKRSSAGMVLDFLESEGNVEASLAEHLRRVLVDYVDAVDVGARQPEDGVPCFSMLIGVLNESANEDFDKLYERGVAMAMDLVGGLRDGLARANAAKEEVQAAMKVAAEAGRKTIHLDRYMKWKPAYFENDGANHSTQYVLFPGKGDWRVVTIPVAEGSREDKRKLPEEWGGLEGEELQKITGTDGAKFCHRNRFIAGFATESAALDALQRWDRA